MDTPYIHYQNASVISLFGELNNSYTYSIGIPECYFLSFSFDFCTYIGGVACVVINQTQSYIQCSMFTLLFFISFIHFLSFLFFFIVEPGNFTSLGQHKIRIRSEEEGQIACIDCRVQVTLGTKKKKKGKKKRER